MTTTRSQRSDELSRSVGQLLQARGWTLAAAESCTGGMLAGQIVAISGSSNYFLGGVVAYSNAIKENVLKVPRDTLATHGAVSWQTASRMAKGARSLFGADVALSTTGIAGPTGGSPAKPVGTVYVALAAPVGVWWEQHLWSGSRLENIDASAEAALALLHRFLSDPATTLSGGRARQSGRGEEDVTMANETRVNVETWRGSDGLLRPTAFNWRGRRCLVTSQGRTWLDEEGGRHYLVMSDDRGSFELFLSPDGEWRVSRAWQRPPVA